MSWKTDKSDSYRPDVKGSVDGINKMKVTKSKKKEKKVTKKKK